MQLFCAIIAGCKRFTWVGASWGSSRTQSHSSQSSRSQCEHKEFQTSPTSSTRLFEYAAGSERDNDFRAKPSLYICAQLVPKVLYHISTRSNQQWMTYQDVTIIEEKVHKLVTQYIHVLQVGDTGRVCSSMYKVCGQHGHSNLDNSESGSLMQGIWECTMSYTSWEAYFCNTLMLLVQELDQSPE